MKLRTLLAAAVALLASACADGAALTAPPVPDDVRQTQRWISEVTCRPGTAENRIQVGTTAGCYAVTTDRERFYLVMPDQWSSSAPSIISVDPNGIVTAHQVGTAVIYAYVDGMVAGVEVEAYP